MRVGEAVSMATVEVIASSSEIEAGTISLNHPRCGRTVIRRTGKIWRVEECERPDPAPKEAAKHRQPSR